MNEVLINFNGKDYALKVSGEISTDNLNECLNYLNSDELFDYLYKYHKDMFDEINNNPYYDGDTINSGLDLKNSIEQLKVIACVNDVIYICGEYWCDPEHGFSIKFPGGKFIKSKYDTFDYDRDVGKDANFIPVCTILGQFTDYL